MKTAKKRLENELLENRKILNLSDALCEGGLRRKLNAVRTVCRGRVKQKKILDMGLPEYFDTVDEDGDKCVY